MDKNIKKAIKKAIGSGFKLQEIHLEETAWGAAMSYPHILLDPLFWQCLGKAEGWDGYTDMKYIECRTCHEMTRNPAYAEDRNMPDG